MPAELCWPTEMKVGRSVLLLPEVAAHFLKILFTVALLACCGSYEQTLSASKEKYVTLCACVYVFVFV